jgi:hypothetical protein
MPTPGQVRSEMWMAITHGATGIIYFCHEFKPREIEAGLLSHPEIVEAVKAVNAEVARFAPVLNAPTVTGVATSNDTGVATLCKRHEGALYLFAVSLRGKPVKASLVLAGVEGKASVEAIGEARRVEAAGGRFEDEFEPYGVHFYKLDR